MKKGKILIVDDDRNLANIAALNFPTEHFDTEISYSGKEAIANVIPKNRPDLILMDVMMPDMDGWEVLTNLKANPQTAAIPVIMCTAKEDVGDVEKSFQLGAQAYVMKPIDFSKLVKKIAVILDMENLLNG